MTTYGFIFDMDGVLFDSHPIHRRAWRQLLEGLGKNVPEESLDFILDGAKREEILQYFLGPLSQQEVALYSAQKDAIVRKQEADVRMVTGVQHFLNLVEEANIPVAVATSATTMRTARMLNQHGLTKRFKTIITGDDVDSGKSNPAIFFKAAERLGVAPTNVLVFEDSIPAVRVVKKVGMKSVGIASGNRKSQLLAAGADIVVPDFRQMTLVEVFALFSPSRSPEPLFS